MHEISPELLSRQLHDAYLWVLFSFAGVLLSAALLVVLLARQINNSQRANRALDEARAEAARASQRLTDALETMTDGFVLFDADDRLVLCNSRFREFFSPALAHLIGPGRRFEEMLRASTDAGDVVAAKGQEEAWIAARVQARRHSTKPVDFELSDGRWVRAKEWHTGDGGLVGTRTDITELKKRDEELQESQFFLQTVIDTIPAIINVRDENLRFVMVNQETSEFLGKSREELIGEPVDSAGVPYSERARGSDRHVLQTGEAIPYQENLVEVDGRQVVLLDTKIPIKDDRGGVKYILTVSFDVAERKRIEEALRDSERRFRTLVEQAADAFFVHDLQGRFVDVNQQACRTLGYTRDELLKLSVTDVSPWAPIELRRQRWKEMKPGDVAVVDGVHRRGDGTTFPIDVRTCALDSEEGPIFLALFRDATELKQFEEVLQESQSFLQTLIDTIPAIINVKDSAHHLIHVNRYMADLHGIDRDRMIGKTPAELGLSTSREAEVRDRQVYRSGSAIPAGEIELVTKDGLKTWLETKVPIEDDEGGVKYVLTVAFDIDERKQMEQSLRASEERYSTLVETSPHGISEIGLDGVIAYANPAYHRILGHSEGAIAGKAIWDLLASAPDRESLKQSFAARVKQHIPPGSFETRWATKLGATIDVQVDWNYTRDQSGAVGGFMAMVNDVTDRKRAEEVLRASQIFLKAVIDTLPAIVSVKDRDHRYLMVNHYFARRLGTSAEYIVGKRPIDLGLPLAESVAQMDAQVLDTDRAIPFQEMKTDIGHGPTTWMSTKVPIRDGQDTVDHVLTVMFDISDRKRTEEELRASQTSLKTVIDTIPAVISVKDRDQRYAIVNRTFVDRFGGREEELLGKRAVELGVPFADSIAQKDTQVFVTGQPIPFHEMENDI